MTIAPLILRGQLKINSVDVSNEVELFKITGDVNTIVVPPTLQGPKINKGGAALYHIAIDYYATDGTDGQLFEILWAAVGTASKELPFEGYMHSALGVSTANPKWTGTFVVSSAMVGGDIETLSAGSATFPMTGAPTQATS